MPRLRQERLPAALQEGGPSAMLQASGTRPFKPYRYGGITGPVIGDPRPGAAVAAEHSGADAVGRGTDWDPLAAGELDGDQ